MNRPEKLAEAVLFSIQRYQLNRVVTIRPSKIEVTKIKKAEGEKSEGFGRLFDRRAFGDVKKIFFHDGENVVTFILFFTSVNEIRLRKIRPDFESSLKACGGGFCHAWQWEFHHHTIRSRVHSFFIKGG